MLPKIPNRKLYDLLEIVHRYYDTLKPNQKLRRNQFGTLRKIVFFGTMRLLWQVHMRKKTRLINSKNELMNCPNFKGRSLLMRYETCNPWGRVFQMGRNSIKKLWLAMFLTFMLLLIRFQLVIFFKVQVTKHTIILISLIEFRLHTIPIDHKPYPYEHMFKVLFWMFWIWIILQHYQMYFVKASYSACLELFHLPKMSWNKIQ
jgi:hypothetical protein